MAKFTYLLEKMIGGVKNTLKYLVGKKNISTFAPAKVRIALARELTIP
jgi:hypothetical protein